MINTLVFKYEKKPGQISERVFLPLAKPSDNYWGIDITELDLSDQVLFTNLLNRLYDEHKAKVEELMANYDITYNYRSFNPSKMSKIEES